MKTRWPLLLGFIALVALGIVLLRPYLSGVGVAKPPENASPTPNPIVCYGRVDVESGVAGLSPVQPGRVTAVCVAENADVEAGALLLRVDGKLAELRVAEAKIALIAAGEKLEEAGTQVKRHAQLVALQQGAIKAAKHRRAAGDLALLRKRELVDQKLLSPTELAAAEEEGRVLHVLEEVEATRLVELELQNPRRAVRLAELEKEAASNRVAQARKLLAECELRAPEGGTVLRLLAAPGDLVGTPSRPTAIWFVPKQPYCVRAEVDQEAASRLADDLPALIAEEGSEQPTWTGKVRRIARWVHPRRTIVTDPFLVNDTRTVECLVSIDHAHPPLRIGQRMRVQINPQR